MIDRMIPSQWMTVVRPAKAVQGLRGIR